MHAAQRALVPIVRNVRLGYDGLQAMRLELLLAEGAGEESSCIFAPFDVYDKCALKLRLCEDH
jgi:hypothetical protein